MTVPSTILRVKRRLDENPQDAFILMCKRARTDTDEVSPSLFVFQKTVDEQDSIQLETLPSKYSSKLKNPSNVNDIIQKMRKEHKEISAENRYEVVNLSRSGKEYKSHINSNYDLVDVQQKNQEDNAEFAYDLYISAKQDFDISMLDNLVSIENYETTLIFGSHRDNGRRTPSNSDQEASDDSNDENNWRNEYPDTENSSIDEEDMVQAMKRCDLDELSSDTGEDKIFDEPPDLFSADANRYGIEYAKYKARVLAEDPENKNNKGLIYYSKVKDSDEESLGYKDDSDDGFYYGQEEDTEQFRKQYNFNQSSDECEPD